MPAYRIYREGDDGNFSSAPEFVECADDKEVVDRAMQGMNDHALEIWEHDRLVAQLPRSPLRAHSASVGGLTDTRVLSEDCHSEGHDARHAGRRAHAHCEESTQTPVPPWD
jgi:hypothetical protein